jgi:ubiquinone biosynthesis protein Coq4
MNLGKLLHMYREYRAGALIGDVAVLKLDALYAPRADVAKRLESVRGYYAEQDLGAMRALPAGTLGREYARFLDSNGIAPLVVSADVRRRYHDRPYALRFTATHDLHHVLAGFDTGLAGEAGVLAFNVGQGSAPVGRAMLSFVRVLYALASPTQAGVIGDNVAVGLDMGRRADLVIAAPLESLFERSLEEVREMLHIPDPRAAGVKPSGRSWIAERIYPPPARG